MVMVSGANRGLGLAIAAEMSAKGWHVSAGVRTPNAAEELKQKLDPSRSLIAPYEATKCASALRCGFRPWAAAAGFGLGFGAPASAGLDQPSHM